MTTSTADPRGAQAHARAMAGQWADAMPTLPASTAADRPGDVAASQMLWAETIAPGGYAAHRVPRGTRVLVTDRDGDACLSMLLFNAAQPQERLNVADTMKIQWNAYLTAGKLVLSDMGRVMASILTDDTAGHDLFCGASNAAGNASRYGDGSNYGAQPNARDRFAIAVANLGLGRKDIHPCLNLFKPVHIGDDGATTLAVGPHTAGQSIMLRAEMDLILVFANCPHPLDTRAAYTVTPARILAWRADAATTDDPLRTATPEAERAFLNTDDLYGS